MRHYVYDFDSTLYATQTVWEVWSEMLIGAGFDAASVFAAYQEVLPRGYSPIKHADALGVSDALRYDLIVRFRAILTDRSPSLLFDDVAPFVESRRDVHRQTILTQGDEEHQWEKMRASGIDLLVPRVVITVPDGSKTERLAEMLAEDPTPITFVDDNPHHLTRVHASGLPITIVRMMRPGETLAIAPHELDGVAWKVVSSLRELD
ncbi:MAG: hypothetical protein WCO25_02815 [Candidatus Uhrbacteria bacterium]